MKITPILGISAGYCEKLYHNRLIDSHWTWKYIAQRTFTATNKGRISIKFLLPFHVFRHLTADVKKNTAIPLVQVVKT